MVTAVIAIVGGVIFGISRVADVSDLDAQDKAATEKQRTEAWEEEALAAFGGPDLTQGVLDMVEGSRLWLAGERPTEQFKTELERQHNRFLDVIVRLDELREFPYDERVDDMYRDAADMYLQTVRVYQAMITTPPGDVRTQHDLLARRVRILGDRVFDRARELIKPTLHEEANPDVDIRLPEEVPNWVEEGIAPGPPLDDPPPAPSGEPTLRRPTRPQQPRDDWLAALEALDLPPALLTGDLRANARALIAAAEQLRTIPDPEGDREEGARIRLSLLIEADAARAGQLELNEVARRLAIIADRLWSGPGLPQR